MCSHAATSFLPNGIDDSDVQSKTLSVTFWDWWARAEVAAMLLLLRDVLTSARRHARTIAFRFMVRPTSLAILIRFHPGTRPSTILLAHVASSCSPVVERAASNGTLLRAVGPPAGHDLGHV